MNGYPDFDASKQLHDPEYGEPYREEDEPAELDEFAYSYVEAALFTEFKDKTHTDIDSDTLHLMIKDCEKFQREHNQLIERFGYSDAQAGHNFWMSRNGHGTGFFEDDADELQEAAQSFGTFDLYEVNGKIFH